MKIKVAVVQDSPVFFDKEATFKKIETICINNASKGCQLIVFPESFIPGYPRGLSFGTTIGERTETGRQQFADYYNHSFDLKSNDLVRLEILCREQNIFLVIGVTEKQEVSGSLFCSMLFISPSNGLLGVHRKLKPTGSERIIWSEGDAEDLVSFKTKIGKLGGLICWENYMPLARMSMYLKGVEIYIAPTADSREQWTATMQQIAMEGRCFVLGCNQYMTTALYPDKYRKEVSHLDKNFCPGGSVIVSPRGTILEGPLFNKPGVLVAELDLEEVVKSKLDFDVIGHYSRDDVFKFEVINQPETKIDLI